MYVQPYHRTNKSKPLKLAQSSPAACQCSPQPCSDTGPVFIEHAAQLSESWPLSADSTVQQHTIHIHALFAGRHLSLLKIALREKGSHSEYPNIHEALLMIGHKQMSLLSLVSETILVWMIETALSRTCQKNSIDHCFF